ncbi:unnamed protein product [Phaeothamnion confervicola]
MGTEVHSSLQEMCDRVLDRCSDIWAIIISTGDGVPIVKAVSPNLREGLLISELETSMARYFSLAVDHASKMSLGALRASTTFYKSLVLVHINLQPLVVTCVHDVNSNIGTTLDIIPELAEALEPIRVQVDTLYK